MYGNNYGNFSTSYNPFMNPQNMAENLLAVRQQQAQMQQPASNGIIWVQGEAGAKSYMVAPNSTVVLWDSENPVIYLKSADQNGIPSMRILDWVERKPMQTAPANAPADAAQYVPLQDFQKLAERFEELAAKVDTMTAKPTRTKKEGAENG